MAFCRGLELYFQEIYGSVGFWCCFENLILSSHMHFRPPLPRGGPLPRASGCCLSPCRAPPVSLMCCVVPLGSVDSNVPAAKLGHWACSEQRPEIQLREMEPLTKIPGSGIPGSQRSQGTGGDIKAEDVLSTADASRQVPP